MLVDCILLRGAACSGGCSSSMPFASGGSGSVTLCFAAMFAADSCSAQVYPSALHLHLYRVVCVPCLQTSLPRRPDLP